MSPCVIRFVAWLGWRAPPKTKQRKEHHHNRSLLSLVDDPTEESLRRLVWGGKREGPLVAAVIEAGPWATEEEGAAPTSPGSSCCRRSYTLAPTMEEERTAPTSRTTGHLVDVDVPSHPQSYSRRRQRA